jgi:hypothetical protein
MSPSFETMSSINIEELVNQVIAQLNLNEDVTRKSIGLVLSFVKKMCQRSGFDFDKILQQLPGAETLIERSSDPLPSQSNSAKSTTSVTLIGGFIAILVWLLKNSPMLDILKRILSMFFGDQAVKMIDSAGDGAELLGSLDKIGISKDQGTKVVTMLVSFMKQHVGSETIDELIDNIPALKSFLGDTTKKEE